MTFLTAASSSNLIAVIHDASIGHTRLSIPLYQSNGTWQSTLTCSFEEDNNAVQKLIFTSCGTFLCALFGNGLVVVWNVERGVVVHTLKGKFLDITTMCCDTDNDTAAAVATLYCLVGHKKKLYVHEYSLNTGKVVRKIKCGKGVDGNLAVSDTHIVVRQEGIVRCMSQHDGRKVGKCQVATHGNILAVQGSLIAAVTSLGVTLLSCETLEHVGEIVIKEQVHSVAISKDLLLLVNTESTCELYDSNNTSLQSNNNNKSDPWKPIATMTFPESDMRGHFSNNKNELLVILRNEQGEIHIQQVDIQDKNTIVIKIPAEEAEEEMPSTAKRSHPMNTTNTVLGPGQAGTEAMHVSDRPTKKQKTVIEHDISIEERLKQLAQEMEVDNDDDDDNEKEVAPQRSFRATTESLSNLLQQSLQSGDDAMLELSLTVRDKRVIELSLQQLEPNLISSLLTKVTTRLASKPNRAGDLALWIQLILTSGKIRNVHQLRPLRNLLHERVESFPHLLKLEGRLSVLAASSLK